MNKKGSAIIIWVVLIIVVGLAVWLALSKKSEAPQNEPELTEEIALSLIRTAWEECSNQDKCPNISFEIEKQKDTWQVIAVCGGCKDDSLNSYKITAPAYYKNNEWTLGEPIKTWRCQQGRGHQEFSTENCI